MTREVVVRMEYGSSMSIIVMKVVAQENFYLRGGERRVFLIEDGMIVTMIVGETLEYSWTNDKPIGGEM